MARKEKKYHFIYKTTNIITGRYYYGMHSTNNLNDGYLGSGRRLRYSINKYGKENHKREIIEYCFDRSSLKKRENELVNLNEIAKKDCMNLKVGGNGGFSNEKHRKRFFDEAKRNAKLNSKLGNIQFSYLMEDEDWRENQLRKQSIGIKKEMSEKGIKGRWEGKHHSEKSKIKIGKTNSLKQKGKNNSQYNTYWITNGDVNKKLKKNEKVPQGWYYGRIVKKQKGN